MIALLSSISGVCFTVAANDSFTDGFLVSSVLAIPQVTRRVLESTVLVATITIVKVSIIALLTLSRLPLAVTAAGCGHNDLLFNSFVAQICDDNLHFVIVQ